MATPQYFFGINILIFVVIAVYGFYEIANSSKTTRHKLLIIWLLGNVCYIGWFV